MAERREAAKQGKQEQSKSHILINSMLQEITTREGLSNLRESREIQRSLEEEPTISADRLLETSRTIREIVRKSKEFKNKSN